MQLAKQFLYSRKLIGMHALKKLRIVSTLAYNWSNVCWSPERRLFVAVGITSGAKIQTSNDGITWTPQTIPDDNFIPYDVVWSPELRIFCACGLHSVTPKTFMTSPDGITWTLCNTLSASYGTFKSIVWIKSWGMFVALTDSSTGTNPKIATSTDGLTWTYRTTPNATTTYARLIWCPELGILMAAYASGTSRGIMFSQNGTTWTQVQFVNDTLYTWTDADWSPELGLFVAVGYYNSQYLALAVSASPWAQGTTWRTSYITDLSGTARSIRWCAPLGVFLVTTDSFNITLMPTNYYASVSPYGCNWNYSSVAVPSGYRLQGWCWVPDRRVLCGSGRSGSNYRILMLDV